MLFWYTNFYTFLAIQATCTPVPEKNTSCKYKVLLSIDLIAILIPKSLAISITVSLVIPSTISSVSLLFEYYLMILKKALSLY